MTLAALLCVAALSVGVSEALYSSGGDVAVLTSQNFKSSISKGGVWMVEFYAPW